MIAWCFQKKYSAGSDLIVKVIDLDNKLRAYYVGKDEKID